MNLSKLVIQGAGQKFQAKDFRQLRSPGVYLFLLAGEPLYIGSGSNLLLSCSRTHSHRKRTEALELCDEVWLYPCNSVAHARELEQVLIEQIRPKHNTNLKSGNVRKWLGIGRKALWKMYSVP